MAYLRQIGHAFPEFVPSAALLLAYWFTFRIVYVFRAPLQDANYREQQGIASFAAILNSVGLLSLLKYQSTHPEWAFIALLALGVVELTLAVIARGTIRPEEREAPRNRPAFIVLSTIASVVLLAAIPFRFQGASWSLLWLLEAEAFFLVGIRLPEAVFRRIGILASLATGGLLVLGAFVILAIDSGSSVITLSSTPHHPVLVLFTAAIVLWLKCRACNALGAVDHSTGVRHLRHSRWLLCCCAACGVRFDHRLASRQRVVGRGVARPRTSAGRDRRTAEVATSRHAGGPARSRCGH